MRSVIGCRPPRVTVGRLKRAVPSSSRSAAKSARAGSRLRQSSTHLSSARCASSPLVVDGSMSSIMASKISFFLLARARHLGRRRFLRQGRAALRVGLAPSSHDRAQPVECDRRRDPRATRASPRTRSRSPQRVQPRRRHGEHAASAATSGAVRSVDDGDRAVRVRRLERRCHRRDSSRRRRSPTSRP